MGSYGVEYILACAKPTNKSTPTSWLVHAKYIQACLFCHLIERRYSGDTQMLIFLSRFTVLSISQFLFCTYDWPRVTEWMDSQSVAFSSAG